MEGEDFDIGDQEQEKKRLEETLSEPKEKRVRRTKAQMIESREMEEEDKY